MFDTRIEICAFSDERDEYNERTDAPVTVAVCYAQKTESGGRENLFASRIIHENEIVYTIRFRDGICAGQFVKEGERSLKITSVHAEGRRKFLHLKTTLSDAEN